MKINPARRCFVRSLSAFHVAAYRMFGGRGPLNRHVLLLTTRGRKTGRQVTKPLLHVSEGERLYIVASYGGSDAPPAWYLNLAANPEVTVERGTARASYRARTLAPQEAEPIWPRLLAIYPAYATYRRLTDRQIPVVELSPSTNGSRT